MVKNTRSKGCRTCVDRHVKCDQTRPYCLRCQKSKRSCPGYEPSVKFQDEGPKLRQKYAGENAHETAHETAHNHHDSGSSSSSSSASPPSSYGGPRSPSTNPDHSTSQALQSLNLFDEEEVVLPTIQNGSAIPTFELAVLDSLLSPASNHSQLLSHFLTSFSPNIQMSTRPALFNQGLWLGELAFRAGNSPVLDWAMRAMAVSYAGRQGTDQSLMQNSRKFYGKALHALNTALQDPVEGMAPETLSATILLSFYEMLNCTAKGSWIRHAGGASRLMQMRGPDQHRTGLGRATLLACRIPLILEAFAWGTPCFLDTRPWRELSEEIRESSPHRGNPLFEATHDFYVEFVQAPGFVFDARYIPPGNDRQKTLEDLILRGRMHRKSLKEIYARFVNALRLDILEPVEILSPLGDQVFPFVYEYPNIFVGSMYVAYWNVLSVMNRTLLRLESEKAPSIYNPGNPTKTLDDPSELAGENITTMNYREGYYHAENVTNAYEICKSAEYLCTPVFLGSLFLIFALRTALEVLENQQEKDWVIKKLLDVGKYVEIAKLLPESYQKSDWKSSENQS